RVLSVPVTGAEPTTAREGRDATTSTAATAPAELHDELSGLTVHPGRVTALVSADPDETARIATRLGLLGREHEDAAAHVRLGGVPLAELGLAEVRRRVVVAESTPELFTGLVREELAVRRDLATDELMAALLVADA